MTRTTMITGAKVRAVAAVLFLVLLTSLNLVGCGKKPVPSSESSSDTSSVLGSSSLREADVLAVIPEGVVSLAIVDARAFTELLVESLAPSSSRGALRARFGLALDEYGRSGEVVQLLGRPLTLSALTMGVWAEYADGEQLFVVDASVLPEFEDGHGPAPLREGSSIQLARRGRLGILGTSAALERALALLSPSPTPSPDSPPLKALSLSSLPASEPFDGAWEDAPILRVYASSGSELVPLIRNRLPLAELSDVKSFVFRVGARGALRLGVVGERSVLHHTLALAYERSLSSQPSGENEVPRNLEGWTNWMNLVTQGAWARLRVSDGEDGIVNLDLRPVDCGSAARNVVVWSALWSGVSAVAEELASSRAALEARADAGDATSPESAPGDAASPSDAGLFTRTFSNVSMEFAENCDGIGRMSASLPVSYGKLGADPGSAGVLLLADYGALIREALPTGFHVLPFALSSSTLSEAFGERPFGLSSLQATGADVVVYVEAGSSSSDKLLFFQIPSALSRFAPPEVRGALRPGPGGMSRLASPVLDARLASSSRLGWQPLLVSFRSDALASVTLNRVFLDALADSLDARTPRLSQVLSELDSLSVVVGADLSLELMFRLRGSDADAADFVRRHQGELSEVMLELVGSMGESEATWIPVMFRTRFVESLATQVRLEAVGARDVRLTLGLSGRGLGVGFVGFGFYAAMTAQRVHVEGGRLQGPLYPVIRDMEIVPAEPDR